MIDDLFDDELYDIADEYEESKLKAMLLDICYQLINFRPTNVDYELEDGSNVRIHNAMCSGPHSFASFSHGDYESGLSSYGYAFYQDGYEFDSVVKNTMDAINEAYYTCVNN